MTHPPRHGRGIPVGTDTAFAVALIVLLGDRVPVELRVFLTAAVVIDDIVAILVIALFDTGAIHAAYLVAGVAATALRLGLKPIFALANAGVSWSPVRCGLAEEPGAYTWRQLCGSGALGGSGSRCRCSSRVWRSRTGRSARRRRSRSSWPR